MKVKNVIITTLVSIFAIGIIIYGCLNGFNLTPNQILALKTVSIIAICSAAYCFIVGELAKNYSQMDKLWSILPEVYLWVIAFISGMNFRIVIMAILATLWGIRLTFNFARKGAYSIKFWSGEEDYRWSILRNNKILKHRPIWVLFNLLFISIYQNFVVLTITLPAITIIDSNKKFCIFDIIATILVLLFLVIELIADEQQWRFYKKKKELLVTNNNLNDLPLPYSRGFNTTGLWSCSRHPNYLGEQLIWISMFIFTIGARSNNGSIINWSVTGCMLLVLLFMGSSSMGESISSSKYSEYSSYQKKVSKYLPIPWKKYK